MHRTIRVRGVLLFLLLLGTAWPGSTTLARNDDGSWEVGAYILNSSFNNDSGVDDSQGAGLRGAYHFTAVHALEVAVDSVTGDDRFVPGLEIDTLKYSVDYLRNFFIKGHEKAIPFITFGTGLIDLDNGTVSQNSTFYGLGGGFRYWMSDHVGVRFGAKIFRWRGDGDFAPSSGYFSFDVNLGVAFLFGGGQ